MADRKDSSSKSRLTVDQLKKKTIPTREVEIELGGEQYSWKFQAISGTKLDALQMKYPPTKEQRARGLQFNADKFGPALVAACSVEPEISVEDAMEIWKSEEWTTGELNTLFETCIDMCMGRMQVNPFGSA